MAEIISIENDIVKIGTDDGKVITAPIAALKFENPRVGDKVKVYQDGKDYIVNKESSNSSLVGDHKVNKHLFVWVFNFLLGGFGIDRFIRGQVGLGVLKLLFSWATLGIWPLVDWIISIVKAYGSDNHSDMLEFDDNGKYLN